MLKMYIYIYINICTEIILFYRNLLTKITKYISKQATTNNLDLTTQPLHYPTSAQVKDLQEETGGDLKEVGHAARMPGFTSGAPYWVQKVGWVGRWIGG